MTSFHASMPDGKTLRLNASQSTFVSEGTHPPGSTWSLIPMPPTLLGPCCLPGPNDTDQTPNKCEQHEASYCQGPMVSGVIFSLWRWRERTIIGYAADWGLVRMVCYC